MVEIDDKDRLGWQQLGASEAIALLVGSCVGSGISVWLRDGVLRVVIIIMICELRKRFTARERSTCLQLTEDV